MMIKFHSVLVGFIYMEDRDTEKTAPIIVTRYWGPHTCTM